MFSVLFTCSTTIPLHIHPCITCLYIPKLYPHTVLLLPKIMFSPTLSLPEFSHPYLARAFPSNAVSTA